MIPRRRVLAAGPLALAACGRREPYFGKSTPPTRQSLIYEIGGEPSSLDPATSLDASEFYIMPALFEGLVSRHPGTLGPGAALATHYQIDDSLTELTFYLRGHPNPSGTKLPGGAGRRNAALWSDGRQVSAHDFVYGWRRLIDPANGGNYAAPSTQLQTERRSPRVSRGRKRWEYAPSMISHCASL